jgi:hypothetical protein
VRQNSPWRFVNLHEHVKKWRKGKQIATRKLQIAMSASGFRSSLWFAVVRKKREVILMNALA